MQNIVTPKTIGSGVVNGLLSGPQPNWQRCMRGALGFFHNPAHCVIISLDLCSLCVFWHQKKRRNIQRPVC